MLIPGGLCLFKQMKNEYKLLKEKNSCESFENDSVVQESSAYLKMTDFPATNKEVSKAF